MNNINVIAPLVIYGTITIVGGYLSERWRKNQLEIHQKKLDEQTNAYKKKFNLK